MGHHMLGMDGSAWRVWHLQFTVWPEGNVRDPPFRVVLPNRPDMSTGPAQVVVNRLRLKDVDQRHKTRSTHGTGLGQDADSTETLTRCLLGKALTA
jgi:hypothetical protein